MDKDSGWSIMLGVSNSTITNGMYPPECASKDEGGDGSLRADIEVFIPDLTPNAVGKPTDQPIEVEAKVEDPFEKSSAQSTIPKMHTIKCQYMGKCNELIPCIHKGEQVWVLQYSGGNIGYYWLPMGRDEGIRLHEHIRWFAMNQPKSIEGGSFAAVSDDNSYFIDVNTNKGQKFIHIHTAVNDGEPYGYDIRIMPEKSWLEIIDTVGNYLHLDSLNTIWKMRNINESYVELNKMDITISCLHDLTINVGNDMITNVGVNKTTTVGQHKTLTVTKNIATTSVSGSISTTTSAGNIINTVNGTMISTASALISMNAPVYNNLSAAVSCTGGGFSVVGGKIGLTAVNVDITGSVLVSIMGLNMNVATAHGTFGSLGGF